MNSHGLYGIYKRKFSRFKRIQKHSLRNILKDYYKRFKHALQILESDNLAQRRDWLCLNFANKCLKNDKMKKHFPKNKKIHQMESRNEELFKIKTDHTERLKKSQVTYMQYLLNNQ